MSSTTIEKDVGPQIAGKAELPASPRAHAETNFDELSGEDQLWHLKAEIRSEYPKGFYFIAKDGLVTNEPWMLVDIIEKPLTLANGATHEGHVVRVRRMNGEGDVEEYPLGDFMERRLGRRPH